MRVNRFSQRARINLEWSRDDVSPTAKRSPRSRLFATGSAPPYKDKKLSSRFDQHQKPGHGPAGAFAKQGRGGNPTLRHIVAEDLREPCRLLELFRQSVNAGLVNGSECDRLRFFAAAEHAKAIGTRNPCGLFATLVRRKLWHYATLDDEDAARRRLRAASQAATRPRTDSVSRSQPSRESRGLVPDETDRTAIRAQILESPFGNARTGLARE